MDFKLIKTFLAVSNTLNITETAENLYVSQSTISHQLKTLENEVGVKLIDRNRGFKKVNLTSAGEEFMKIALEWENLNNKIKKFSSETAKENISIASLNSINNFMFDDVYKEIFKDPAIRLTVKTEHTDEIYEQITSRTIDVGFVTQYIPYPQIDYTKLIDEEMVLVTKSKIYGKSINPEELNPEKQIYFAWGDEYLKWHNKYFSYESKPKLFIDLQILAFDMVDEDSWLIAPLTVASSLKNNFDGLYIIPFVDDPPTRTIFMINHKSPLDSSKKVITKVKLLIKPYIDEYYKMQ